MHIGGKIKMNWWKSKPDCTQKEKERNNKIWNCIRDFFIDPISNLIIKILKKIKDNK